MNKYNFDKKFDRSNNFTRKWDKHLITKKFNTYKDVIPMDIADLDFEVAPEIKDELIKIAKTGDYNYSYVHNDYYDTIINWHKRKFNLDIKKEWIKLTFGTCSVIHYLVQCFCNENESVLINTPCYEPFLLAAKRNNTKAILNKLIIKNNKYFLDFEKIEQDIVQNKVKLYILCSPQNPSGRIWEYEELEKLSNICMKHNVILVSDEVHRDIIRKNEKFYSLWNIKNNISNHSIICSSPNKTFNLGGLKGSYILIKNKKIREKFLKYLEKVYVTSPHIFMQPAHITAYTKCDDWLDELNAYIENNFILFENFIKKEIPKIKIMHAQSSFLVWINLKNIFRTEKEIINFFNKIKVSPVLGSYFSAPKNSGWVRLNLGMRKELLLEVLNRIKNNIVFK